MPQTYMPYVVVDLERMSHLSFFCASANPKQTPRQPEAPNAGRLRCLRLAGMPQASKARGLRRHGDFSYMIGRSLCVRR